MFIKTMLYVYFFSFYSIKTQEYPFSNYKKIFHTKENFERLIFLKNQQYFCLEDGHYVNFIFIPHLNSDELTKAKESYMRAYQQSMQELQNQFAAINNTMPRRNAVARQ